MKMESVSVYDEVASVNGDAACPVQSRSGNRTNRCRADERPPLPVRREVEAVVVAAGAGAGAVIHRHRARFSLGYVVPHPLAAINPELVCGERARTSGSSFFARPSPRVTAVSTAMASRPRWRADQVQRLLLSTSKDLQSTLGGSRRAGSTLSWPASTPTTTNRATPGRHRPPTVSHVRHSSAARMSSRRYQSSSSSAPHQERQSWTGNAHCLLEGSLRLKPVY